MEQIPPCMCCNKYHGYSDVYLYDFDTPSTLMIRNMFVCAVGTRVSDYICYRYNIIDT